MDDRLPSRILYAFAASVAGLGVPFNWLLWRAFSSRRAWWESWLKSEFNRNYDVYVVMAFIAVSLFAVAGYILGKWQDDRHSRSKHVEDSNRELSQLATTDSLTGLFNSRYIHDRLEEELENAYQSPLTCLLIDIDHFKKINDRYGHPFGDQVLAIVSSLLKKSVRRIDAAGRLGGEEFMILLPNTPKEKGIAVAERIRETVVEEQFLSDGKAVQVTISIGVVTYPSDRLKDKASLFKAVDTALYKAKREGRNRVVPWEPTDSESQAA